MTLAAPGGLERIVLSDVPPAKNPAAGEITVRIEANAINYHDLAVATGVIATADGRILLGEASGKVEAVGEEVVEFALGDRVVSCLLPAWQTGPPMVGGLAQSPGDGIDGYARGYVTTTSGAFTRAPSNYSAAQAATIPSAGVTAWRALMINGRLEAGQTVLVQGSGGVSIVALQIALAAGAKVIATSSSETKLRKLIELGAHMAINYRDEPEWGRVAYEWAGGQGVDHVLDVAGSATLAQSLAAVKIGGHIAMIGILSGSDAESTGPARAREAGATTGLPGRKSAGPASADRFSRTLRHQARD